MSIRSLFFRTKVAPLPTVAKRTPADFEARRLHVSTALRDAHRHICMTAAQLALYGSGPARDDAERMDRARAAVAILQRAV
jgi:hypothetical protein